MNSVKVNLRLLTILLLSQFLLLNCSPQKKITSIDVESSEFWNNKGMEFGKSNKLKLAYDAFKMAIKANPNNFIALYNKAIMHERWKEYDKALIAINQSLKINPDLYETAWNTKATILNHSNKNLLALDAINQALSINKHYAEAWYHKGVILYDLNKKKQSMLAYEQAVENDPTYSGAWYNRGVILDGMERYDEAIESYEHAIKAEPSYSDAWFGKGLSLSSIDKPIEARLSFEKATLIDSNNLLAWESLGLKYYEVDEYEKTLYAFNQVIRLARKNR